MLGRATRWRGQIAGRLVRTGVAMRGSLATELVHQQARLVQRLQSVRRQQSGIGLVLPYCLGVLTGGGKCRDEMVLRLVVRGIE